MRQPMLGLFASAFLQAPPYLHVGWIKYSGNLNC